MLAKPWSRLWTWISQRRDSPCLDLNVVLYTRAGCHLCEEAWQMLTKVQRSHAFVLSAVDIDSDPELRSLYSTVVPVVTMNGKLRFRGGVNGVLLNRLLRHEAEKARKNRRPD